MHNKKYTIETVVNGWILTSWESMNITGRVWVFTTPEDLAAHIEQNFRLPDMTDSSQS